MLEPSTLSPPVGYLAKRAMSVTSVASEVIQNIYLPPFMAPSLEIANLISH